MKLSLATLSLVVLMAVPAFASEGAVINYKLPWRADRQSNMETIADKVGVPVEELLAKKQAGAGCEEFMEEYDLSYEELRESRLEEQYKLVDERVAAGNISEEEGQVIKERIESYRFLQDGKGPHQGNREGMKLNINSEEMRNLGGNGGRGQGRGQGKGQGQALRFQK